MSSTCRLADELVPRRADADVGGDARANDDAARSPDRLQRVARDVEQRLDDLVAIDLAHSAGWVVVAIDDHAGARFAAQQVEDVLAELVHVDQRLLRRARRADHRIDQRGQAVGLADDDAGVFAQVFVSSRSSSCAAPRSPPSGFLISCASCRIIRRLLVQARQQLVLARDALALRGVGELQQQVRAGDLAVERRDGDVDDARARAQRAMACTDSSRSDSVSPVSSARRISRLQRIALEHQRRRAGRAPG